MVDAQLECQARAPRRTSFRRPRPPQPPAGPRVPPAIASRFEDLVCVVGEANAWPYERGGTKRADELVHWVAHRPSTGETFERVVAPAGELSPNTRFHTGLEDDAVRAGIACAGAVADFARFVRPTDIVCAWGHYSPDLLAASGGPSFAERLDLRGAAQRLTNRKIGSLEDFASTIAPTPPSPMARGRAGRRLAMIVEIVRAWRGVATT
jgi:hypothetical protein